MKKAIISLLLCFAVVGCSTTRIRLSDGTEVERKSFLTNPKVGDLSAELPGGASLELKNYSHEQMQAAREALKLAADAIK